MNSVSLIGRLAADPELKYTPSGIAVCSFRIAVDRQFKDKEGNKQTDWINIRIMETNSRVYRQLWK